MQKNIDIVITMAGLGSRFRQAGYNVPKYMIKVKGKTLFEYSMMSLYGFKNHVNQYIFIALKDDFVNVKNFIIDQLSKLEIKNYKIIILDELTDGQATTAMFAQKYWKENNALLIYNIDTYVESGEMSAKDLKGDGFIPCFKAKGDHWSFVKLDDDGNVVEIKEKQRISDFCTIGAYYFASCHLFCNLYNDFYKQESKNNEKYIAPLYNHLLDMGGKIYITEIAAEKVHVLGTPEELEQFLNE